MLFRPERGKEFAGNRNSIEHNRIVDSGDEKGVAIDVQGTTESIVIAENEIVETRGPAQRSAVRLGQETRDIKLLNNTLRGFATDTSSGVEGQSPKTSGKDPAATKPAGNH
ncbi:MAG: hypothetical protein NTY01_18115 [Verrucomicrobia bacterium]|nr:hypothetical protein [Verrucomicrobiota bacterium]